MQKTDAKLKASEERTAEEFTKLRAEVEQVKSVLGNVTSVKPVVQSPFVESSNFVPTKVLIRGRALVGSSRKDMIGRKEYNDHANEIVQKLPTQCQQNVSVDKPGPYNFQIVFKVKGGRLGCEHIRETLNSLFESDTYTIKGTQVKASIETSPDRRAKYRIYQTNLEVLKAEIDPQTFDVDERVFKIYNVQDASIIGEFPKGEQTWKWNDEVLAALGLDKGRLVAKAAK